MGCGARLTLPEGTEGAPSLRSQGEIHRAKRDGLRWLWPVHADESSSPRCRKPSLRRNAAAILLTRNPQGRSDLRSDGETSIIAGRLAAPRRVTQGLHQARGVQLGLTPSNSRARAQPRGPCRAPCLRRHIGTMTSPTDVSPRSSGPDNNDDAAEAQPGRSL